MKLSSWERWPDALREKWRDDLRDRNFWLNGYSEAVKYNCFSYNRGSSIVIWTVCVGPMASFTRAMSGIHSVRISKSNLGPFEHTIKVDLESMPTPGNCITSTEYQLTLAAAKQLGLLNQEYKMRKENYDQLQYYTYGCDDSCATDELVDYLRKVGSLVGKLLSAKKYFLVVDNLQSQIELGVLSRYYGFPPLMWADSVWLISPTSQGAYKQSSLEDDASASFEKDECVVFLTMFALRQSAEHILNMIRQESIDYWHVIAIQCFHYTMAIFAKHSQVAALTSDELMHQWATLLPNMIIKEEESNTITSSSKYSSMLRVGRVILEAFQKYSLLQLPFSPASEADEATCTAAQFFAYHGLIAS